MSQISFYNDYNNIAIRVQQFHRDYSKMTTANRAITEVTIEEDMNKILASKLKDEMTGKNIDTFA